MSDEPKMTEQDRKQIESMANQAGQVLFMFDAIGLAPDMVIHILAARLVNRGEDPETVSEKLAAAATTGTRNADTTTLVQMGEEVAQKMRANADALKALTRLLSSGTDKLQ